MEMEMKEILEKFRNNKRTDNFNFFYKNPRKHDEIREMQMEQLREQKEFEEEAMNRKMLFAKALIEKCEMDGLKNGYSKEKVKDEINKALVKYMKELGYNAIDMGLKFAELNPYEGFNINDFMLYVIRNSDSVFLIGDINKECGENAYIREIKYRELSEKIDELTDKYISAAGLEDLRKQYGLRSSVLAPVRGEILSENQIQNYVSTIESMIYKCHDIEELYNLAKEQMPHFTRNGDSV